MDCHVVFVTFYRRQWHRKLAKGRAKVDLGCLFTSICITLVSGINSLLLSVNRILISLSLTYLFLHLSLLPLLIHHSRHSSVFTPRL